MINKPKGTKDIFGIEANIQQNIIKQYKNICSIYNFNYIETPIFEKSEVFIKNIGKTSDIVNMQMYFFKDKSNRNLVLRPENTASIIRAYGENKLYANAKNNRLYYYGPMFRYERPQKGRYRQFTQLGLEALHNRDPLLDAEIILLAIDFLKRIKICNTKLIINTIGTIKERNIYLKILTKYFKPYLNKMDLLNQNRSLNNPLRILDDKTMSTFNFVKNAPSIFDSLSEESKNYFLEIQKILKQMKIEYSVDKNLVRGLDYYSNLVFEIVTNNIPTQKKLTLIGGGRYDNMIKNMIGIEKSGIGFSIGVERLTELFKLENLRKLCKVFVALLEKDNKYQNLDLVKTLRANDIKTAWNTNHLKFKKIMNIIKNNASNFLIFKEHNENAQTWKLRNLETKKEWIFKNTKDLILKLREINETYK